MSRLAQTLLFDADGELTADQRDALSLAALACLRAGVTLTEWVTLTDAEKQAFTVAGNVRDRELCERIARTILVMQLNPPREVAEAALVAEHTG